VPFGQIGVDERFQRTILGEELGANHIDLLARGLQSLFHQFVLGFEVRVETTVSQAQCFHQRLQTCRANAIAAKAR
jgi:hypothetical protein